MDATTSTIFLKLVGHTDLLGDFVVYTAGNFRGGSGKIFELRNAYVSARGFTAGYDYGSFMDLGNVPATIDFAGPNGMSIYHATQIRYEHALAKGLKAGIGAEMPVVSADKRACQYCQAADAELSGLRSMAGTLKAISGAAAIIRSMTYDDLTARKAESEIGWGVRFCQFLT